MPVFSPLSKSKYFVIVFRLFSLVFSVWGIIAITGIFKNAFNPVTLLAYTVQSNILVAVFFCVLLTRTILRIIGKEKHVLMLEKPYGFFPRLSAFVSLAIFVTMLVFWFILAPVYVQGAGMRGLLALDNLAVHLITPLLMLMDYLLFTERGKLKKYDPLLCAVIPYAYLLEAMILGLTRMVRYDSLGNHSYYPYIFLDIDRFGAWVILMVAAITLFFMLIAFFWQRLDKKLGTKARRPKPCPT
ncbi:MAG: Pr6Pr family membrane protein [Treponema sp.]|jgi:hypothetical protein|nr:Pr6Pr family membrane protein [Treponema sp.]